MYVEGDSGHNWFSLAYLSSRHSFKIRIVRKYRYSFGEEQTGLVGTFVFCILIWDAFKIMQGIF